MLSSKLNFLALIVFYIYLGNTPDTETLFYILTIYQQLSTALSVNIPTNLSIAAQIHASIHRINTVLQAKEDYKEGKIRFQKESCGEPFINLKNVTVMLKEEIILRNISLDLKKQCLIAITGTVGSGKSSLLKLLVKDYFPSQGKLQCTYFLYNKYKNNTISIVSGNVVELHYVRIQYPYRLHLNSLRLFR